MANNQRSSRQSVTGAGAALAEVKARVKEFAGIRRTIRKVLESGEKTIPQIAQETGMPVSDVTYYLMTLMKFGDVAAGDMDDADEYYFYRLKREK